MFYVSFSDAQNYAAFSSKISEVDVWKVSHDKQRVPTETTFHE